MLWESLDKVLGDVVVQLFCSISPSSIEALFQPPEGAIANGGLLEATLEFQAFIGLVSSAEATVGRPLTPVSVAGVARRTARRN